MKESLISYTPYSIRIQKNCRYASEIAGAAGRAVGECANSGS